MTTTATPGRELLALREIASFNITPGTGASVAMRMRDIACNAINAATARLAAKPDDEIPRASEPANGLLTLEEYRENLIKEAANCVPTNWCDSLLTGPKHPLDNRGVETLLRGIQDRIRALSTTGEPKR